MSKRIWTVAVVALGLAVAGSAAEAQRRDGDRDRGPGREARWENLGCVEIGRRQDLDVIEVGRREGRFTAIKLAVSGNDVSIEDLRVIYANGDPDRLQVRSEFREGTESRAIDLAGRQRAISRIELVSKRGFRGRGRGRARICVSGLQGGGPRAALPPVVERRGPPAVAERRGGGWEELGCQKVGFLTDRDTIRVGRREGGFKALRVAVSGNDIRIDDMVVIYGNGEPDRLTLGQTLREGTLTAPIDLKGFKRAIQQIDLKYRAKPNLRGSARVCVSGLK